MNFYAFLSSSNHTKMCINFFQIMVFLIVTNIVQQPLRFDIEMQTQHVE